MFGSSLCKNTWRESALGYYALDADMLERQCTSRDSQNTYVSTEH